MPDNLPPVTLILNGTEASWLNANLIVAKADLAAKPGGLAYAKAVHRKLLAAMRGATA